MMSTTVTNYEVYYSSAVHQPLFSSIPEGYCRTRCYAETEKNVFSRDNPQQVSSPASSLQLVFRSMSPNLLPVTMQSLGALNFVPEPVLLGFEWVMLAWLEFRLSSSTSSPQNMIGHSVARRLYTVIEVGVKVSTLLSFLSLRNTTVWPLPAPGYRPYMIWHGMVQIRVVFSPPGRTQTLSGRQICRTPNSEQGVASRKNCCRSDPPTLPLEFCAHAAHLSSFR